MILDNKAIARSYLEDVWNAKRIERIDDLVTDTFTDHHYPPDFPLGPKGAKRWFTLVTTAFPDINCGINDIISVEAVSIYQISDGKISESWVISGLLAELLKTN